MNNWTARLFCGQIVACALSFLVGMAIPCMAADASEGGTEAWTASAPDQPAREVRENPIRAQLRAKYETILSAGIAAKVAELPFQEGDSFHKGDMLVRFDCSMERAEQKYAQAELRAARVALNANEQLDKLKSISVVEVETSRAQRDMAAARVRLSEARLRDCQEIAPFNGRVAHLDVSLYQRVKPGEQLMSILDPSVLEVELRVPSLWMRWLRPGQKFSVHIDEVDQSFPVTVVSIGAQVDPVSQTISILGELRSGDAFVLPGMSGEAHFPKHN